MRNAGTLKVELMALSSKTIARQAAQENLTYDEWNWFIQRQIRAADGGYDIWTHSPKLYTHYPRGIRLDMTPEEAWVYATKSGDAGFGTSEKTVEEYFDFRETPKLGSGWTVENGDVVGKSPSSNKTSIREHIPTIIVLGCILIGGYLLMGRIRGG